MFELTMRRRHKQVMLGVCVPDACLDCENMVSTSHATRDRSIQVHLRSIGLITCDVGNSPLLPAEKPALCMVFDPRPALMAPTHELPADVFNSRRLLGLNNP